MNVYNHRLPLAISALIISFLFLIPSLCSAEGAGNEMSMNQEILVVQGKVTNFNQEKQLLTLKTKKGKRIKILLDLNTSFVGYSSAQDIAKENGVKVWYMIDEQKQTAVKIEKKIDVGC